MNAKEKTLLVDNLPKEKSARIIGTRYLFNGEERFWDGKNLRCTHEKFKQYCRECNGSGFCKHGKVKQYCRECNGSVFCKHDKIKYQCRECDGIRFCKHHKRKSECKECGGSQICEHNTRRNRCKICVGSQVCSHGNNKYYCRECGGGAYCKHDKIKRYCVECDGSGLCEHQIKKYECKLCDGSQVCLHKRIKKQCSICDTNGHLIHTMRTRLNKALNNQSINKSNETSIALMIGCSMESVKNYLENMFEEGMSWSNRSEWHIDHRRPCASFNLENINEQKMCFHYTNLQPLWAKENLSKNTSFDEESFNWEWNGSMWVKNP